MFRQIRGHNPSDPGVIWLEIQFVLDIMPKHTVNMFERIGWKLFEKETGQLFPHIKKNQGPKSKSTCVNLPRNHIFYNFFKDIMPIHIVGKLIL